MMEAWFSSSERTPHPGAAEHREHAEVGGEPGREAPRPPRVPFQAASAASSSAWTGRDPVTRREAPDPAPQRSRACVGGGHHRRMGSQARGSRWRRRRRPARRAARWAGRRAHRGRRSAGVERPGAGATGAAAPPSRSRVSTRTAARPTVRVTAGHPPPPSRRAPRQGVDDPRRSRRAVMVSGGMSTTTSPSGRSSTPRATAPAHTRRPQRTPGVGRRQLDADHQAALADLAHRRPGRPTVLGQQDGQLVGRAPARWPARPTPR